MLELLILNIIKGYGVFFAVSWITLGACYALACFIEMMKQKGIK